MQGLSIARLGRAALDVIYPPKCVICSTGGVFLCDACIATLPQADGRRCDHCWLPLQGRECLACMEHPTNLQHLRSVFQYEGRVRHAVHAFKFGGQSSLGPALGGLLAEAYMQHKLDADLIVPVPLTASRRRIRGYNQALLMATELSHLTDAPVEEALKRTGHGHTQAGSANAEERRHNVGGVFELEKVAVVTGKHILLIDDVATTGATLDACAAALLEAGAARVSALTLARED
jgi:ComF family protein